jgi:stress-induced morphogen
MQKTLYLLSFFALFFLLGLFSCSEIFEEDLSKLKVRLNAPSNKVVTSIQTQQFWWNKVEGATEYNIQIVSPAFDSVASIIANQRVETDTFYKTLAPGRYQWTVSARNSNSVAVSDTFSLIIIPDTAQDLRRQTLLIESPINEFATNQKNIIFKWQKLVAASEYRFQIASPDFTNSSNVKIDKRVNSDTISTTLEEGVYRWRVRAENDKANTDYAERTLIVDLTAPSAPTLIGPLIDSLSSLPVQMRWNADINNSEKDTLYIYKDSTAIQLILKQASIVTNYSFRDTTTNLYYWRVRSVDKAGNNSLFSPMWWFRTKK